MTSHFSESNLPFAGLTLQNGFDGIINLVNRLASDALLVETRHPLASWAEVCSTTGVGVYCLFDRAGKPVYAGRGQIRSRVGTHFRKVVRSRLAWMDYTFAWKECSMEAAVSLEIHVIERLQPAWNGTGFGNNVQSSRRGVANTWQILYGRYNYSSNNGSLARLNKLSSF